MTHTPISIGATLWLADASDRHAVTSTVETSWQPLVVEQPDMSADLPADQRGAVLIPVKAFGQAKVRLSGALEPNERATLAEQMATHVVQAQRDVLVAVCCDDDGVAAWAERVGAHVIWCPGTDLNGAVQQAFGELGDAGVKSVAVAHGDLPLAASLHELVGWSGVTLVPDRHRSGTNVLVAPTDIDFRFQYGTGSLALHVAEAVRHRRGLRIVHDARLGWDIDHPADLDLPEGTPLTAALLHERLERQLDEPHH